MINVEKPGAHLDHMMRTTRLHHVQLSAMADVKASIVLTVSSVLITISAPQMSNQTFRHAGIVLIFFCLLTIFLATYAIMPKLPFKTRPSEKPDVSSPLFNLLFFGDFTRLSYDEFESAMEKCLSDHNHAYQAQIRELYTLGMFLATKKYRFLQFSYLTFITGLTISGFVLLF